MKILANKKINALFRRIFLCLSVFIIVAVLINLAAPNTSTYIFLCSLCMAAVISALCYDYFKKQYMIIEAASTQITNYIAGDKNARIECDDEGELYRLFHEVNSLVSILNSHAENELKSKEFLKNTIADISHQLKTPLAALNIYNGILQDESENSLTIKKFTNLSERELDRIETLVQNLLKIAKLEAGTIVTEKSEENISEMITSIKSHFEFRAKQEEKIIVLSGDDCITLSCDRNWLIEAISNIVKNALEHTQKGNEIFVIWKQFASVVQITIKDNGNGIHPEDLNHIFKRFYRSRFSKDTQTVGLGLPIAKAIIEAHSGTIEVESELDIGTTFTINFLIPTKL